MLSIDHEYEIFLQNRQELGWNYFAPTLLTSAEKTRYAFPRIVFSVFARSGSADGEGLLERRLSITLA
jgi:hypothetical protein